MLRDWLYSKIGAYIWYEARKMKFISEKGIDKFKTGNQCMFLIIRIAVPSGACYRQDI